MDEDKTRALEAELERLAPGTEEYFVIEFELMKSYGQAGRIDEAESILAKLLQAEAPMEPKARAAIVVACSIEETGDFERAVLAYRRAVNILSDPRCLTPDLVTAYYAHNNLAYSLNQVRSFQEGEAEARAAIEVAPEAFHAYKNLGVALEGQGRFAEAVHAYRRAVEAAPTEPRARTHLEDMIKAHPEIERDPSLAGEIMLARSALRLMFENVRALQN